MKAPASFVLVTLFSLIALTKLPQTVFALELSVDSRGVVSFYEDGVLGDSSEDEKEEEKDERKQETKKEEKKEERKVEIKKVDAAKDKRVEIKAKQKMIQVGVESEVERENEAKLQAERIEAKRVRAQFSTKRPTGAIENETEDEDEIETENETETNDKRKLTEAELKYRRELVKERYENEDALEVKSKLNANGEQELELQSDTVNARLRGADFAFDPETNTVVLTTPSGQEHELNHLPDQALERINAVIQVEKTDPAAADVTLETSEVGTVYRTTTTKRKKLFGLFNRDVQTEIILDDETGEVITKQTKSPGILGQLFDAFTF